MKNILQINASIFSENGQSTRLADQFAADLRASNPGAELVKRDLASDPIPHLTAQSFGAFLAKADERTAEQKEVADFSDRLIEELRRADVLVLGVPMYNFGIPSTLKAYIDHVARAGVTFKYTESGPVGLLEGKKAYIFASRGGAYAGTPRDSQTTYLRDFLQFIGITDVEFVYAEGLALGEERKQASLEKAQAVIRELAQPLRAAA
ncbi:MAG TPA: FMN-dependent NADH-azoreductase [Noviherbaspirillum sp.]|nr:FMN-dependent NADH-azoreductase [Noviherbaspirillum sp.]